ncbi:MAG: polar amino acid ABC transporter ATP-binding protein [Epulopiscium sp. Nuni2H_MBin003]|nr:MAG: polar amino acid ABC transporter ATP-binding protein [Epulopiscium sp. Nuni2H_MBin003]
MNIKINNLTKTYDNQIVLDNISLEINNTSTIGIIGKSGCGKSTLLRQLAGIEEPDGGEIIIDGLSPITDKIEFQKSIGVVFQKHNLFPHLTLKENISLILRKAKNMNKQKADSIAKQLLEKLFIENEADKRPNMVSGGQNQRCSIARALATDPKLIFLDEPTAALDPILTNEVLKAVNQLKNEGINFIFVTHEIHFLKQFADYIIFFENGIICEHGDVSCLQNPQTTHLAQFLGGI